MRKLLQPAHSTSNDDDTVRRFIRATGGNLPLVRRQNKWKKGWRKSGSLPGPSPATLEPFSLLLLLPAVPYSQPCLTTERDE